MTELKRYTSFLLVMVLFTLIVCFFKPYKKARRSDVKCKRRVYLYWVGKEYKLISILRNLIYLHSNSGTGYDVHLITKETIDVYVKKIPQYFDRLNPAHQADFVRTSVLCDHGGIWLDSDTLVVSSLDSLFDLLDTHQGFFIKERNDICNGVFGSRQGTSLMTEWKRRMLHLLDEKQETIGWTDIGNAMLTRMIHEKQYFFSNYKIFDGTNNLYPILWDQCVEEYIEKPYENYKTILRDYQPLLCLANSVYRKLEEKTVNDILQDQIPLQFFLRKSFDNMELIDYDFIEIGTSSFDTLLQVADEDTKGLSVEALKYYLDQLPTRRNVKKINVAISDVNKNVNVYYIPESMIRQHKLPDWFLGCNSINDYHPLHIQHKVSHFVEIEEVQSITAFELFYQNRVSSCSRSIRKGMIVPF